MTKATAEAPSWIPILPKPGVFTHPTYGKIEITASRSANFVQNVNDRVYGQDLPVDAEHQTKLSGAFGWIKEARLNEDGSADARVEWNERGEEVFRLESHKYISPEWYDVWTEPLSNQQYEDVLIGAALTTRPYFKTPHLRPLIACGDGRIFFSDGVPGDSTGATIVLQFNELPLVAAKEGRIVSDTTVQLTEDEVKAFREAQAKVSDLETQLKTATEEKQATDARVATLEAEAQTKRFTDLVMGRGGGGDGAVFVGEVAANVESLRRLAVAFGEDSEGFTAEVALRQATAKTLKASDAFKPIGSSESGEGGSAWDQVDTKAQALRATEPTLTIEQARERVMAAEPELKRRVYHEERGETRRG